MRSPRQRGNSRALPTGSLDGSDRKRLYGGDVVKVLEYLTGSGKMSCMSWRGANGSGACLSRVKGHWGRRRRGRGQEERGSSGLGLLRSRCFFSASPAQASHSCLTRPRSLDLSATLPFWKPNFAEWDRILEGELSAGRLTALVSIGTWAVLLPKTSHPTK